MKREVLWKEIFEKLDISQTMYDNATEKYKNIANVLVGHGLDAYIYPQGSFGIGTVIRPYKEGEDKDYDLDFVCQINGSKDEFDPEEIKNSVGDILKEDGRYSTKLIEYNRCWTIEYADIADGIGFKIDIVPATSETQEQIYSLISRGIEIRKAEKAIAITHKENNKFTWISSNPAAYTEWFEEKNRKAFHHMMEHTHLSLKEYREDVVKGIITKVVALSADRIRITFDNNMEMEQELLGEKK